MKIRSLNSLFGGLLVIAAMPFLASCGGGGAAGNPDTGPQLQLSPLAATVYAGVPFTMQISGGRTPYALTSSEPDLFPLPASTSSHSLTVIANNPGVIDTGLPAGSLPVRSVLVTVRSGDGQTVITPTGTAGYQIAQNFLIGYGATFTPSNCGTTVTTTNGDTVCAGSDATVSFDATTNGNLHGNEAFCLTILQGNAILVDPATGNTSNTVAGVKCQKPDGSQGLVLYSDHTGHILAILRVPANTPTQTGVLRIQEVSTGVYHDIPFLIAGNTSASTLTAVPNTLTFTGATTDRCGTGSSDVLVFDGTPPYTAVSSNSNLVTVTPSSSATQPGRFTLNAANSGLCGTATVTITDSTGAHTGVTVTTQPGSATPPPAAFTVVPTSLTLGCGQTGSASAVGGSGTYAASSPNPEISTTVTASTIAVTRQGANPGVGSSTFTVNVTDGSTTQVISVTAPTTCS